MAKTTIRYVCGACGAISLSWSGKCQQCGNWNTLQEEVVPDVSDDGLPLLGKSLTPASVSKLIHRDQRRLASGWADVDQVLGGGFVAGSITLIAGEPGIGKSTLLLQLADAVAAHHSVLYVSGEESAHQVGLRAARLTAQAKQLQLATSNSADDIAATISSRAYELVVIDSIQTVATQSIGSGAGSISQITSSTQAILTAAKASNVAAVLVGHVTKEGAIAGPKVLEHVVDVVLQLEGDRYGGLKVLRATKNRFGPTTEAGIFEMAEQGLRTVENPSAALLAERQITDGSVVLATLEGSRPLLVEIQALVNKTSYGYPKRAASGIDLSRLNLLVAMLERRTKLRLSDQDIYINCVGGMRITEPAADLAICLAIGSATKAMLLKTNAVVFGEVGLSGEIRHVPFMEKRVAEAKKLGFAAAIGPLPAKEDKKLAGFVLGVRDVRSALNQFLTKE
ncbi:MAG TPA: DNA repair protein RadA [Candidatus Saccharimonadales bacterium]|nr:DNA repair protein RadA [Candidatus Saccharimonadales bacterium]